ncbi:putative quinol monooxygenase [uncultured Roseobacter sp.]|uniref:putative quinol monooxygenase n=1 Tax=uncultured Roseobacter sp. TaxID=114847 RepID=UPI0026290B14|nr:putative quinol monooxygenase [uncultured Roseobacter sp.]
MFAVVVTFQIKPEHITDFMPLMLQNAQTSRREEPGCHQFDVATSPDRPGEVFLYELYDDEAAFEAHLKTTHFKTFDEKTAPMIAAKTVITYAEVVQ